MRFLASPIGRDDGCISVLADPSSLAAVVFSLSPLPLPLAARHHHDTSSLCRRRSPSPLFFPLPPHLAAMALQAKQPLHALEHRSNAIREPHTDQRPTPLPKRPDPTPISYSNRFSRDGDDDDSLPTSSNGSIATPRLAVDETQTKAGESWVPVYARKVSDSIADTFGQPQQAPHGHRPGRRHGRHATTWSTTHSSSPFRSPRTRPMATSTTSRLTRRPRGEAQRPTMQKTARRPAGHLR